MLNALGAGLIAALVLTTPVVAEISGTETYNLLFKNGTLDDVPKAASLQYERTVTNALKPETALRDTGEITLAFDDKGAALLASLTFRQGEKYRNLGIFPASVGNPMIMYFVETVARDMGETAGGSLFYIRNRIKDALITPSDPMAGEADFQGRKVATTTVVLRPFEGDPNAKAMQGFGELEMTVTMSDEVPGWYHTLSAKAPVYSSTLVFEDLVAGQ